jgi:transposase InsO family protein
MRDMVTSLEFRHFSIRALALHAQRVGRVFAAPGTWLRYVKANGWPRPRRRVHPAKPKEGVRTTRPDELWHMDVSIIKLLDGTRLFLHAVVDNFSRRLLAWELATKLDPTTTCRVLEAAGRHLPGGVPTIACDSGGENVNGQVDELIEAGTIKRILAQVEVAYSNSMIEAWFRSLKHSWLFLHTLDSVAAVEKLVAFYAEQHNAVMPHSQFNGRTPDEVYFGTATDLENQLVERRRQARAERIVANRELTCADCDSPDVPAEAVARKAA